MSPLVIIHLNKGGLCALPLQIHLVIQYVKVQEHTVLTHNEYIENNLIHND